MTQYPLNLDDVLDLIMPFAPGDEKQKKCPSAEERKELFGTEAARYPDTPLTLTLKSGEDEIRLRGVADAVHIEHDFYAVEEEILTQSAGECAAWQERGLLRARFLALALCNTKALDRIRIRLSFFFQGRVETQTAVMEKAALSASLTPYIQKILSLAPLWKKAESVIEFPHKALRDGQKDLIRAAWGAIKAESKLFACAPTGIGKTLAVLYPALKALETGKAKRIFYASPKNPLKLQAAAAVEDLQKVRGLRTLILSAKMSLCPSHNTECLMRDCPRRELFGEKLSDALSYLSAFPCVSAKELSAAAESFGLCPFELALKYADFCQVIIGDYNHIFDPKRRVISPDRETVCLVDEAHNLPTRIRESYTECLAPSDLDFLFRDNGHTALALREHLSALTGHFARIDKERNEKKEYFSLTVPAEVAESAKALAPKLGFALHGGWGEMDEAFEKRLKELFSKLKKFCALAKLYDDHFATVFPPSGGVKIYLVDPRDKILEATEQFRSTLFFSATLQPEEYYFQQLGGRECDDFLTLSSPFPKDNLFVGICPVDVSYSNRATTAGQLCSIIHSAVSAKEGHYMVFLPSFDYLNLVSQEYKRRFFDHRVLIQKRVMNQKERVEFLRTFEETKKGTLIGFCVLGGIFSEGVDLKGDSLLGEILVGTGFPPPSPEAEAESAAYYKREMDGKSFAYTLPGWSRVLQAAGRVIRDEEDRGVLLLCDARYRGEDIKELFPESWEEAVLLERDADLKRALAQFWK